MLGAWWLGERLQWNHWLGILVAALGMVVLSGGHAANASLPGMTLTTLMLTLAAAASWACGNLCNKQIMRRYQVNAMSLVVWSALIPVGPFLLCSWVFEGADTIVASLITMRLPTMLALMYLSFISTLIGYAIWGNLLSRYETWRVAPLSLLVPVVGILSASLLLGESLSGRQLSGAALVMLGLLVNVFGARLWLFRWVRQS
ncbi:hypothetical protein DZS_33610 [Dickeya ananatis]